MSSYYIEVNSPVLHVTLLFLLILRSFQSFIIV